MNCQQTLTLASTFATNVYAQEISADHQEARQILKEFGGQLVPALKGAMKEGGPVAAVDVCYKKAPAIAQSLSEKHGWNVNRVSLKARGASATPDAYETEVLQWFDSQIAAGADPKTLEKFEVVSIDGKESTRYMKPVMTAGLCLTCHGTAEQIPAGGKQKLAELYPNDAATGYQEGQVRGAFSFQRVQ